MLLKPRLPFTKTRKCCIARVIKQKRTLAREKNTHNKTKDEEDEKKNNNNNGSSSSGRESDRRERPRKREREKERHGKTYEHISSE